MPAQLTALTSAQRTVSGNGTAPFPGGGAPPLTAEGRARVAVTGAFVVVPSVRDRPQAALPPPGR
jgi:hypothetical protein